MTSRKLIEAKLAEYRQAVKDHEAAAENHRQLAILNEGAALAFEELLKGMGKPIPAEGAK